MDKAELKTMTTASAALSEALKTCQAGETAIKGSLGMKSDEGIAIALRDLQAAATGELSTHFKAYINLVTKAAASITTPTLPTATTNSRKEPSKAAIE